MYMKIAFVHPALMDYRLELFNNLNKLYDLTFIFTRQGRGQDDVKEKHLKIPKHWDCKIVRSDKLMVRGRSFHMFLKLMRELIKRKYDIILTSTSWYICFPIAKITGKKFILLTEYWHFVSDSFLKRLSNLLIKFIAKHADAIITTGTKAYEAHLNFNVKKEKIFKCIQCAVDYSDIPTIDLRKELGLKGKKIILYLSRIVPHGKPVVTTYAVGAAYDLVKDDYNGYVVKNKDIGELYEALYKILLNPDLAKRMGENSRKMFEEKNNHEKMLDAFVSAINYVQQK